MVMGPDILSAIFFVLQHLTIVFLFLQNRMLGTGDKMHIKI